jgi:hypothetical protein
MAQKLELDAQTGETVERELTTAEKTQRTKDLEKHAELAQAKLDRAASRQAVINKLGLTEDEAAALLG